MKFLILISIIAFALIGCEDVVGVDLPAEETKLIFNALLRVNEEVPNDNRIRISTTGSFFEEIEPEDVETLQIQNESSTGLPTFYAPDPNIPGDWIPGSDNIPIYGNLPLLPVFDPEDNHVLSFFYQEELYLAINKYVTAPEIASLSIGDTTIFDDEDTEIIVTFNDPPDEDNYYVFGYGNGEYVTIDDKFFNGQEYTFSYFSNQNLEPGNSLTTTMWGVDEDFYDYFSQLIVQSEMGEDTLFQTPVTTVRGNILKVEDIDNIDLFNNVGRPQDFVLGYFAIVQERTKTITL